MDSFWLDALWAGTVDWAAFLQWLADEYGGRGGRAGVFLHRFGESQSFNFLLTANFLPQEIGPWEQYGAANPWRNVLWTKPAGFFICGRDVTPINKIRDIARDFVENVMTPQHFGPGIGAILLKGAERPPDWAIGIATVRGTGEGIFTEPQKEEFQALIPAMVHAINVHPELRNWLRTVQSVQ